MDFFGIFFNFFILMMSALTSSPSDNNLGYFCLWACPGLWSSHLPGLLAAHWSLLRGPPAQARLRCSAGSALIGGLLDYCRGRRCTIALSFQIKSNQNVCISKRKRKVKKLQKFLPNANTSWFFRFNSAWILTRFTFWYLNFQNRSLDNSISVSLGQMILPSILLTNFFFLNNRRNDNERHWWCLGATQCDVVWLLFRSAAGVPALARNLHATRHIHFVFVSLNNIYTPFPIS